MLGCKPVHPAHRRGGARPRDPPQYFSFHERPDQASARRPADLVGRHCDELVLARRRGFALAVAAAGEERIWRHRGSGHHVPCHLLDLDRGRLGACRLAFGRAHRPAADACRRRAARPVCDRPRLGDLGAGFGRARARGRCRLWHRARHPYGDRSCRPRGCRRIIHRADLRGGAGLGRRRPPRARDCGRQRAQCRLHDRKRDHCCGAADLGDDYLGAVPDNRGRQPHCRRHHRPHHARERAQRCAVNHLPRAVPH